MAGMGEDDGFQQSHARIHSDNVLPSDPSGFLAFNTVPALVAIGTSFRPRITVRRFNRTTSVNVDFRLQFRLNGVGGWTFITNGSDRVKLVPTTQYTDGDNCLDLLLVGVGQIPDFDNGCYQSEGDGSTGFTSFPSGIGTNRVEPEWCCVLHGSTQPGDSYEFRGFRDSLAAFAVGYLQFGLVDAIAAPQGVLKFDSEVGRSVCMTTNIASAIAVEAKTSRSVCVTAETQRAIQMGTEVTRAVCMTAEIC